MCYEAIELIPIILIDNAIKYSERRSTITLALSHTNSVTKVTVTSYGRPVPDEEIPRLFKRFFRGSNSLESSSTGLGIGLWVVRKILEAHNSSIEYNYENKLREFATNKFVFTLTANGLTR
jgi:signal transduction histidine kinase